MDELPADAQMAVDNARLPSGDAVSHRANTAKLLNVEMNEFARMFPFIAAHGFGIQGRSVWAVSLNTLTGLPFRSGNTSTVGANFGLRGVGYVLRILIPAAFPAILAGLKIGWAFAWRTLVAAELVFGVSSGSGGLGWYIFEARSELDTSKVFAGLFAVILIGLFVESVPMGLKHVQRLNAETSLPGREPSHSVDGVASLSQLNASSKLKARSAKLDPAAANVDREDSHATGSVVSTSECLTPHVRLDNSIRTLPLTADCTLVTEPTNSEGERRTHDPSLSCCEVFHRSRNPLKNADQCCRSSGVRCGAICYEYAAIL